MVCVELHKHYEVAKVSQVDASWVPEMHYLMKMGLFDEIMIPLLSKKEKVPNFRS